jgi:hypothetical protein
MGTSSPYLPVTLAIALRIKCEMVALLSESNSELITIRRTMREQRAAARRSKAKKGSSQCRLAPNKSLDLGFQSGTAFAPAESYHCGRTGNIYLSCK